MATHDVHTLEELARKWKVKVGTIRDWLARERRAGRGPALAQLVVKRQWFDREQALKTCIVVREDYASKIELRYVFRVFTRRARSYSSSRSVTPTT